MQFRDLRRQNRVGHNRRLVSLASNETREMGYAARSEAEEEEASEAASEAEESEAAGSDES